MVVNASLTEPLEKHQRFTIRKGLEKYVPPKNVPILPDKVVYASLTEQKKIRKGLEKYVPPKNVPIKSTVVINASLTEPLEKNVPP